MARGLVGWKRSRFFGNGSAGRKHPCVVHNRLEIVYAVSDARAFLKVQKCLGSFSGYIRAFTGCKFVCAHMHATGLVNDHVTGCFR